MLENSPAEHAGLQAGDRIIKVTKEDGSSVEPKTFLEFQAFNGDNKGTETFTILRDGKTLTVEVTPTYNKETDSYMFGISAKSRRTGKD